MSYTPWLSPSNVIQVSAPTGEPTTSWTNITAAVTTDSVYAVASGVSVTAGTNFLRFYFDTSGLVSNNKLIDFFEVRYVGLSETNGTFVLNSIWDNIENTAVYGGGPDAVFLPTTAAAVVVTSNHPAAPFLLYAPLASGQAVFSARTFDVSGPGFSIYAQPLAGGGTNVYLDNVQIRIHATALVKTPWGHEDGSDQGYVVGTQPRFNEAWSIPTSAFFLNGHIGKSWIDAPAVVSGSAINDFPQIPHASISGITTGVSSIWTQWLVVRTPTILDSGPIIPNFAQIQGFEIRYARKREGVIQLQNTYLALVSTNASSETPELLGVEQIQSSAQHIWPTTVRFSFSTAGGPTNLFGLTSAQASAGLLDEDTFGFAIGTVVQPTAAGNVNIHLGDIQIRYYLSPQAATTVTNNEYDHEIQTVSDITINGATTDANNSEYDHEIASVLLDPGQLTDTDDAEYDFEISSPGLQEIRGIDVKSCEYDHEHESPVLNDVTNEYNHEIDSVLLTFGATTDVHIDNDYDHEIKSVQLRYFRHGQALYIKRVRQD